MEAYGKYISAEKWDNELSPTQPNIETSDLNTYAVRWMVEADRRGAVFGDFFELFQEDFEGWTLEMFNNMGKQVRAQFRKRFVYHGVWVSDHQSAGPVAARLHALLHQRYPPRWTQERIDEALDKGTSFHPAFRLPAVGRPEAPSIPSSPQQRDQGQRIPQQGNQPEPQQSPRQPPPRVTITEPTGEQPVGADGNNDNRSNARPQQPSSQRPTGGYPATDPVWTGPSPYMRRHREETPSPQPFGAAQSQAQMQAHFTSTPASQGFTNAQWGQAQQFPRTPQNGFGTYASSANEAAYRHQAAGMQQPPAQFGVYGPSSGQPPGGGMPNPFQRTSAPPPTAPDDLGRKLVELEKMYKGDEKSKYGGKLYDLLDTKLQVFINRCRKAQIPPEFYHLAFDTMLKDRPLQFYYDNLNTGTYNCEYMVDAMRRQFETMGNQQEYRDQWSTISFLEMVNSEPNRPKHELFDELVDKIKIAQKAMPWEFQHDDAIRMQLIRACYGVRECTEGLVHPPPTFEGLVAHLRDTIYTHHRMGNHPRFQTSNTPAAHLTDRMYNNNRDRSKSRNRDDQRRSNSSSMTRSTSRGQGGNFRRNQPQDDKKCYVCAKPGCWSTNHPADEQRKAFDKFKTNRYFIEHPEQATRDRYLSFLVDFEGLQGAILDLEDNDLDRYLAATHLSDSDTSSDESDDDDSGKGPSS